MAISNHRDDLSASQQQIVNNSNSMIKEFGGFKRDQEHIIDKNNSKLSSTNKDYNISGSTTRCNKKNIAINHQVVDKDSSGYSPR